jgi:hypothetical protein
MPATPLSLVYKQHRDSAIQALDRIERTAKAMNTAIRTHQSGIPGILQIGRDQQTALREAQAMVSLIHAARLADTERKAEDTQQAATEAVA